MDFDNEDLWEEEDSDFLVDENRNLLVVLTEKVAKLKNG